MRVLPIPDEEAAAQDHQEEAEPRVEEGMAMKYTISDEEYEYLMYLLDAPSVYKPKLDELINQADPFYGTPVEPGDRIICQNKLPWSEQ